MNSLLSVCLCTDLSFQTSLVTHDLLTLELNMLSTLQFQSAHSAGSTHWSTAVCALQVLLVTFPHSSACLHTHTHTQRWKNSCGFTASFVGLLSASASLCCANPCKALCFSDTQPNGGDMSFCVVLLQALNPRSTKKKKSDSLQAQESRRC